MKQKSTFVVVFNPVTMNSQLHSAIKVTPYEVVFGIKPSSEPVPALNVIEEPVDDDDGDGDGDDGDDGNYNNDADLNDINEGN